MLAVALGASFAGTAAAQTVKPVWPDEGPFKWAPRPTESAITANDLRTRLYQFADDSMMGRRIGELGNYKGTAYIAGEFKRLGLKPAGENGTYFQEMPYGPTGFDIASLRLIASGTPLALRTDWVPVAPSAQNGFGNATDISSAPLVFLGAWGDANQTLDPAMLRGKVAVFTAAPGQIGLAAGGRGAAPVLRCDSLPDRFGAEAAVIADQRAARADSASGRAGRGAGAGRGGRAGGGGNGALVSRVQEAGAVGILFIALDQAGRAAIENALSMRGAMQPAASSSIGAAAISSAAAAKLFGKPVDQLTPGATGEAVTAHWTYAWHMSPTPARNVIAILPGSDPTRANEYVLVSAHNDHVGVNATAVDHDSLRAVNFKIGRAHV